MTAASWKKYKHIHFDEVAVTRDSANRPAFFSVRFVRNGVDPQVWRDAATCAGGETPGNF